MIDGKKEKSACEMAPFDEALQDTSRRETVEDPYFLITMYSYYCLAALLASVLKHDIFVNKSDYDV